MPLTLALKHGPFSLGNCKGVVYSATFDSSYAAGGETLGAGLVGLQTILQVSIDPESATAGTLIYHYDYTNFKLLAFYPTGGDQTAPTVPAAPAVAVYLTSGAVTVTGSSATTPTAVEAVTPGIAKEVAATADLSAYTVRLWIVGL